MSEPIEAFKNAFKIPELKNRIIFTLIMLAVYRLGCHVPTPGVDGAALAAKMSQAGGLLGFYDMFSGGAFSRATVFALGIMPYITASIILSLLIPVVPALENLQKQGQEGQKKITEYTRYGTIGLCIVQSIGIAVFLQSLGTEIVPRPGIGFILMCIISFTTGTAFIMWLGEQISEQGIGNGISLIIFTSIISRMPAALRSLVSLIFVSEQINMFQGLFLVFLMVLVVAGAILITTGQRRIPVQYPRQVKGRRVSGGQRTYLPLRVNQAGVIPIIFASSLLSLPGTIGSAIKIPQLEWIINQMFHPGNVGYMALYAILIIFFGFFYTAITFNPVEVADNMKKYGGVIVGVRPGKATADYLNRIMTRITLTGSLFLAVVALMPEIIYTFMRIPDWNVVQFFGGTSLLILVGVALDTIKQMEQHLIMRHYDGFSGRAGRIRSRRSF
ncbi:MAG TPA: preprotein translocase subunit SecY [Candidatus Hydrogenedentes bacterium]|nr:preprotein translocase subunit SecY [Candidatus Hydrogenedentota bacterium]